MSKQIIVMSKTFILSNNRNSGSTRDREKEGTLSWGGLQLRVGYIEKSVEVIVLRRNELYQKCRGLATKKELNGIGL